MRIKIIAYIIGFIIVFPYLAVAGPVLLFSNLESAPSSGWSTSQPGRGAAVTVWGYGFGDSRGSSYVTVAGVALTAETDYAAWSESWPTPYWQRITFWLNGEMQNGDTKITVTVNGESSNALDFTIRDGRIFFVDNNVADGNGSLENPFNDLQAPGFVAGMQPGDMYYFRGGVYDRKTNGGKSVLWIRSSEPSGRESQPISLLSYPNETPTISVETYDINFRNGFQLSNSHTVISGFIFDSEYSAVALDHYHKLVGNDITGLKNFYGAGTGIVSTQGNGNRILGNAIHGGNSKNRFDHATYFSGCAPVQGNHLGWNYVYDNDFGRGPELSINHQQNRCEPEVEILKSHYVFNNIVDCSPQRAVALNVYDLSYDTGEEPPEPTYVYNNLILNCGTLDTENTQHIGWAPALLGRTYVHFFNNVIYNAQYTGYQSGEMIESSFKNNIIVMDSSDPLDGRDHRYIRDNSDGVAQIENNLFFDKGNGKISALQIDENKNLVGADPLFSDPESGDFSLQQESPAIDSGANDVELVAVHNPPQYAPLNRDMKLVFRYNFDIGAFEYTHQNSDQEESQNLPFLPLLILDSR